MKKEELRIIYMGTPQFAVEPLRRILDEGCNVVAVVTMPDKPVGRSHSELQASPVKQFAMERSIPVLQPENLKDEAFLREVSRFDADVQVVVAFRKLPRELWAMAERGAFNLHASLLPQYRGAAPINWAIINGETRTGLTTFFLNDQIDTGTIIRQMDTAIGPDETVEQLYDRLMLMGGDLVVATLDDIARGTVELSDQEPLAEGVQLHGAPKLFRDNCRIEWAKTAKGVHDFVRGLSPKPGAWTEIQSAEGERKTVKILQTERLASIATAVPGTIETDGKSFIHVATADGMIAVKVLQIEGKKRMTADELLRGYAFAPGTRFL